MTQFYKELPEVYKTYIKQDSLKIALNLRKLWKKLDCHDLFRINRSAFLTQAGLDRFSSYSTFVDVFRMPPNFVCRIHVDASYHAFNFILTNNGGMEWFNENDLKETNKSEWGTSIFEYSGQTPIESTELHMMLVSTKAPHRIVNNTNTERICLSVRTKSNIRINEVEI
jgi:hypothetical protein